MHTIAEVRDKLDKHDNQISALKKEGFDLS